MRLLLYSDSHYLDEPAAAPGVEPRLTFLTKTFQWIAKKIMKHSPKAVFNLGDTNNQQGSVSIQALHTMCTAIHDITHACSVVKALHVALAGNHDQGTLDGNANILPAFGRMGMCLVERYHLLESMRVVCIAHTSDPEAFKNSVIAARAGGAKYAMIHQPVNGILWRPGQPDDGGVDIELFKDFDFTFGGHYHHPQYRKRDRFAIVGSSCYFNFNDHATTRPRGVVLFDTKTGVPEWLPNPHTPIRHTLQVTKSEAVLDWLTCGIVAEKHYPRLILKVKCETSKVKRNVEKKLKDYPLAKLIVRDMSEGTETAHERDVVLDAPESAIRSFVRDAKTELDRSRLVETGLRAVGNG